MQNAFLPHEDDFALWVEGGFMPSAPETQEYLRFLADPDDERRPKPGGLWPHQWDALLRVIYAREVRRRDFWDDGVLLNIVTGGGKTALIAATMVWLRLAHHVQRFVILCPNLIVRDRLEADFRGGTVFTERELIPPGAIVTADDFALTTLGGSSAATASDLFGANVVLANIHQFYQSSTTGRQNLWSLLQADQTPFAVFNDEAHNTPAPEYDATLRELHGHAGFRFRLDTTATPDRADGKPVDSRMICEYGIPEALNDRVIAMPVVYQPDIETVELTYTDAVTGETRRVEEIDWDEVERAGLSATQWVTDAKPMSQQISIALNRLEEAKRNARGRYQPILFVVAVCIADANAAKRMLDDQFGLRTLIVTQDEDPQAREDAAAIGASGKYDAVVSVAMLREGWDVPEVGVILLLRKFGSRVYGPQVVGRGLRRVRRTRTGEAIDPDEPQICAIVDHPKLDHEWLWELLNARVRDNVGVDQEFDEQAELPEPPPRQELVRPDLVITIPDPIDDGTELDPVTAEPTPAPARDWREQLALFEYEAETVEITRVDLSGVTGRELGPSGWTRQHTAPDEAGAPTLADLSADELRMYLRERLNVVAEQATVEAGYPALLRRHVYPPLLDHVSERWLGGAEIPFAEESDLRVAASRLPQLERLLATHTDIVSGMIEHHPYVDPESN